MKKYSLIFAFVAFAVAVALNFSISKEGKMDDMALANVEALAQESGGGSGGYSCTATTNCNGGSVSCTGVSSCSRTSLSVTCDGKRTLC